MGVIIDFLSLLGNILCEIEALIMLQMGALIIFATGLIMGMGISSSPVENLFSSFFMIFSICLGVVVERMSCSSTGGPNIQNLSEFVVLKLAAFLKKVLNFSANSVRLSVSTLLLLVSFDQSVRFFCFSLDCCQLDSILLLICFLIL